MRPALVGTQSVDFLGGKFGTSISGSNIIPRIANHLKLRVCQHTCYVLRRREKQGRVTAAILTLSPATIIEAFSFPSIYFYVQAVPTEASRGWAASLVGDECYSTARATKGLNLRTHCVGSTWTDWDSTCLCSLNRELKAPETNPGLIYLICLFSEDNFFK